MTKIDPYSPYKRISDRVHAISNQSSIQRDIYDKMSKRYRGISPELSEKELLQKMSDSAEETRELTDELLDAVTEELRRCDS